MHSRNLQTRFSITTQSRYSGPVFFATPNQFRHLWIEEKLEICSVEASSCFCILNGFTLFEIDALDDGGREREEEEKEKEELVVVEVNLWY